MEGNNNHAWKEAIIMHGRKHQWCQIKDVQVIHGETGEPSVIS